MDSPFTREEVKKALFSMGPTKAPSLNGFHALFFQKNWELVGSDMTAVCLGVLNGGQSVRVLNVTHVVLIPKIKNPKRVADFRPISLCNVTYKIITKVLANWLKLFLPKIISQEQSTFVLGAINNGYCYSSF